MKVTHIITEHKKGVKAVKYSKKPQPLVGPEALKKKAKAKAAAPKTELEKHSKLATKLEAKRPDRPLPKTDLKVGDDVVADTSKEDYPGGHKERRGKVTRVGEKGVHIKTSDSDEPEWHPYKIVKKHSVTEVKQRLDAKCWKGKHKEGTKIKGGIRVNNCVPNEDVAEGKIKIKIKQQPETAQEKLYKKHQELRKKSGLPDPEEYKKKAAEKQKEIDDMKEAKQPEAPKPRNFVAKNAKTSGAGVHKDAKKAAKEVRGQKHKNKEMAEGSAGAKYKIKSIGKDKNGDYYISPNTGKKVYKQAKVGDHETPRGEVKSKVAETMGKVVDYKPGVSATIDTGPGMTTQLDLKKNPTSLTKDPATGKLKLMPGTAATAQPSATTQSTVKPGDQVEMPKTNTMAEDILRLAGLR